MNSRSTWIWLGLAGTIFAVIFALERFGPKPVPPPTAVLPGFKVANVTSVQVRPLGQLEIRVDVTNRTWLLTKPIVYPGQAASIEGLLSALEKLAPARVIDAAELRARTNADAEFGFENPRASLIIQNRDERRQLRVGSLTAPGDQVYLEVVGTGVFIVDSEWLKLLPKSVDDWRDTSLLDLGALVFNQFNRITVSNVTGLIELQYDVTTKLWNLGRSDRPRADNEHLLKLLQKLVATRVAQFVPDEPKPDLEALGLQPPALQILFSSGTNLNEAIEFGKATSTNEAMCYARRPGLNAVVVVPSEQLAPWQSPFQDFRDHQLLAITRPVTNIEVHGTEKFTLQRVPSNSWNIVEQNFPADAGWVEEMLQNIAAMKILSFKDAVTAPDLPEFGLDAPSLEILLRGPTTNGVAATNGPFAHLLFGAIRDEKIFVRRTDENAVYAVALADFQKLPDAAWKLRNRRIWNFSSGDVAQIAVQHEERSCLVTHAATNVWTFAPGAKTPANGFAIEEIAYRLGELSSTLWTARGDESLPQYGFTTNGMSLSVELKGGAKFSVNFGGRSPMNYPYAATKVDGQTWVFECPLALYELLMFYVVKPFDPTP